MSQYNIQITRTVKAHIQIEAENEKEALIKARKTADWMDTTKFDSTVDDDEIVVAPSDLTLKTFRQNHANSIF